MVFRVATQEEIRALRAEAARNGQSELLGLCDRALAGDADAVQAVHEILSLADALARAVPDKH